MKLFIPVVIMVLLIAAAYWLGKRQQPPLSKDEAKELQWLQTMREDLIASASEHATLGDDFAVIALGMMRRPTKELK